MRAYTFFVLLDFYQTMKLTFEQMAFHSRGRFDDVGFRCFCQSPEALVDFFRFEVALLIANFLVLVICQLTHFFQTKNKLLF
jgi:hypothetical protein